MDTLREACSSLDYYITTSIFVLSLGILKAIDPLILLASWCHSDCFSNAFLIIKLLLDGILLNIESLMLEPGTSPTKFLGLDITPLELI